MVFFKAFEQVRSLSQQVKSLKVAHLAAVNGCDSYLENWLSRSDIIQLENKSILSFNNPNANQHFVYAGNSAAQGNFELRNASLLSNFKKFNQDKVTLLAGRADLKNLLILESDNYVKEIVSLARFERRRVEIAEQKATSAFNISRYDVIDSFNKEISPKGAVARYLQASQLGVIIEDTLFTHGILTKENIGYVPGSLGTGKRIPSAREWIDATNEWYTRHISNIFSPTSSSNSSLKTILDSLIDNQRSIVNSTRNNESIDPEVVEYLNDAGIHRMVIGCSPVVSPGNLVPVNQPRFTLVLGDTSWDRRDPDIKNWFIHNLEITYEDGRSTLHFDLLNKQGNRELFKIGAVKPLELTEGGAVLSNR